MEVVVNACDTELKIRKTNTCGPCPQVRRGDFVALNLRRNQDIFLCPLRHQRQGAGLALIREGVAYSILDQVARFANAKATNDTRYLDITTVYDGSDLKDNRVLITDAEQGLGLELVKEKCRAWRSRDPGGPRFLGGAGRRVRSQPRQDHHHHWHRCVQDRGDAKARR